MPRQTITSPLSVLLAGVVVIVLLLAGSGPRTAAVERAQTGYETETALATAAAQTATAAYLAPSAAGSTVTPTPTETPGTATATRTTQPFVGTPTPRPSATPEPLEDTPILETPPTPTATPTATPSNELTCAPGVPLEIAGEGPPHAAYLVYFGERAVGGGTVEQDGTFLARLVMGLERAGQYAVTVRVRGTRQVLRAVTCSVPDVTPTPIPRERSLP